jgi:hypothetical protein
MNRSALGTENNILVKGKLKRRERKEEETSLKESKSNTERKGKDKKENVQERNAKFERKKR